MLPRGRSEDLPSTVRRCCSAWCIGERSLSQLPHKTRGKGSITAGVPAAWLGLPRPFSAGGVKELNAGARMLKTHPALICHYKERRSQPPRPARAPAGEKGALTAESPPSLGFHRGFPSWWRGLGCPHTSSPAQPPAPESRAGPGLGWTLGGISSHKGRLDIGPGCPGRCWNHRPWRCLRKSQDMALGAAVYLTRRPSLTGR